MTTPYWEAPEWQAQLQKNVDSACEQWAHDWEPFFRGIAERTGLSITDAILTVICMRVHWWTQQNAAFVKKHMEEEHGDEPWKDKPEP